MNRPVKKLTLFWLPSFVGVVTSFKTLVLVVA